MYAQFEINSSWLGLMPFFARTFLLQLSIHCIFFFFFTLSTPESITLSCLLALSQLFQNYYSQVLALRTQSSLV